MSVLHVSVWRGTEDGRYVDYEVPRQTSQTVLDVVTYIQRKIDSTLAYRYACRVGMCGSCAMTVNGVARWTCRTHVGALLGDSGATKLQIGPLANLPVIRDLATDMRDFFNKWTRAKGFYQGTRTRRADFAAVKPQSRSVQALQAGIECIGCGVCYASCDVVSWRPDYLGPAALNRAWTLMNDVRDNTGAERLRAVSGDAGCHSCHTHISCTERCPKHISPTASIAGLKRASVAAVIKGEL